MQKPNRTILIFIMLLFVFSAVSISFGGDAACRYGPIIREGSNLTFRYQYTAQPGKRYTVYWSARNLRTGNMPRFDDRLARRSGKIRSVFNVPLSYFKKGDGVDIGIYLYLHHPSDPNKYRVLDECGKTFYY